MAENNCEALFELFNDANADVRKLIHNVKKLKLKAEEASAAAAAAELEKKKFMK